MDAFIALIILSIGFIVITSNYSYSPAQTSTQQIANDILNVLQSAKIRDICNPECSGTILNDYSSLIKNKDNTLLELIGELKTGYPSKIDELLQKSINPIMNDNYPNYQYAFQLTNSAGATLRFYSPTGASSMANLENEDEYKKAKVMISSKRIILGYYLDSSANVQYWGPYEAKVRVWQK